MSIARQHAEWLSLVPTSGPFLSMAVLCQTFPQGLPAHDAEVGRLVRQAFEEWESNPKDPAIQHAWIRFVLTRVLGLPAEALKEGQGLPSGLKAEKPEFAVTLRPDLVLMSLSRTSDSLAFDLLDEEPEKPAEESALPHLLVQTYPRAQGLEKPVKSAWTASPTTRMSELLAQTRVPIGLVTNGEEWILVHRVTDTTGFATFASSIWLEEGITLRAFRALLGPERFFGHPDETLLKLLTESADDHEEVTDQLGYQVRAAVEMLVQALDRIDRERGGTLLSGVPEAELYEGALTVMMRLVFLLCAEEREMFPTEEEVYNRHYAISTLLGSLREAADQHGEEILERRCDAWSRLLATFRAIHSGVSHEAMQLPAYGGNLLDPERFPWLDGTPLPLHNRTVLHLLEALQILRVKVPGGGPAEARRLSFRALDIEQIGHVYEGLLDHTAVRAKEPILGLAGTRDKEPEVALSTMEGLLAKGRKELLKFLREETGRSEKALENALTPGPLDEGRLLAACEGDAALLARVRPFAGLVRLDDFDRFVVIPTGSAYVTAGTTRRSTGTHYTPRFLAEQITARTLEPLVYKGVAEGTAPSRETLKSPRELLSLRVCDPTVGSGAFLVAGCRYLADRLCEAWALLEEQNPDAILISPEGEMATGSPTERLIPKGLDSPEERQILARRLVAERCLYGVDKNPMAAEIAKLALWLVTMNRGKPFHFLDHAIKSGDSLLGLHSFEQLNTWSLDGVGEGLVLNLFSTEVVNELVRLGRAINTLPSDHPEEVKEKSRLHKLYEAKAARVRLMADLILAPELMDAKPKVQAKNRSDFQILFTTFSGGEKDMELRTEANAVLGENRPFHWPLEFADVYQREENGGFDAMMGNPPFMGGQKITGELGVPYREYLVRHLGRGKKGSADLVAYFFLRAIQLLREGGCVGLIATNTLAQGDTREVGLDQIIESGYGIYSAESSMPWPGKAALEVAVAHLMKGDWRGLKTLNKGKTALITAFLDDGTSSGKPFRLKENAGKSFIGSYVLGMGFVMEPEEAQALMAKDPKNAEVLFPYLNGEDLNSRPDQSSSRWVINFKDWPLGRVGQKLPVSGLDILESVAKANVRFSDDWLPKPGSKWDSAGEERQKKWLQLGVVPADYPSQVAADYPNCLEIIERLVKPDREKQNRESRKVFWWRYAETSKGLYAKIKNLSSFIVKPLVSPTWSFGVVYKQIVFDQKIVVICDVPLCYVQNTLHWAWTSVYSSTLGGVTLNYTASDCFETFSFPHPADNQCTVLDSIGEAYHTRRKSICATRNLGLTKVYNLFHDPACRDADIEELRRLHTEMDIAVRDAYGWSDLDLRHGFYGDGKETRYTLHPDAKGEVLRRLLKLNHERHAQEEADEAEIVPTLKEEAVQEAKVKRAKKAREESAAYGQLTTDDLFVEQLIVDHTVQATPPQTPLREAEILERAALLATYLVMRASTPERLNRLRRYPARPRFTMPRAYHRVRLVKHLYFTQEMFQAGKSQGKPVLSLGFVRHKKGPYTEQVQQAELLAVRHGWLQQGAPERADDEITVRFELGPNADEAVARALELLGEEEANLDHELLPLDDSKTVKSEQWTTVHKSWSDLRQTGLAATTTEVQADVAKWKPNRAAFSPQYTAAIYQELELRGFLKGSGK